MTIQESFRRFRKEFNLTQAELAATLGLPQTSYNYEKNSRKSNPSAEVLIKLSKRYNVSVDYLLGLTDNPHCAANADTVTVEDIKQIALAFSESSKALEKVLSKQSGGSAQ